MSVTEASIYDLPDIRPEGDVGQALFVPDWAQGPDLQLVSQWEKAQAEGTILQGLVGGLDPDLNEPVVVLRLPGHWRGLCPLPAFDPALKPHDIGSRLDLYVQFMVLHVAPEQGALMVSRVAAMTRLRALLQSQLSVGTVLPGVVRWVSETAAICDIGGLTGLLPRSRMGISDDPRVRLPRGTKLKVGIARIDDQDGEPRITLDAIMPWEQRWDTLIRGVKLRQVYAGTVRRIMARAVLVSLHLAEGLEVVIRTRETLPLQVDDRVRVRIVAIQAERRTIYGAYVNRLADGQ
jgi:ribosomal protein S1